MYGAVLNILKSILNLKPLYKPTTMQVFHFCVAFRREIEYSVVRVRLCAPPERFAEARSGASLPARCAAEKSLPSRASNVH
ncbi:hypothetical protein PC116_g9164 [Phytophthora cactorum]|nr:hypothetical protein PC116_g9164 [Phytophthora cactorum]